MFVLKDYRDKYWGGFVKAPWDFYGDSWGVREKAITMTHEEAEMMIKEFREYGFRFSIVMEEEA